MRTSGKSAIGGTESTLVEGKLFSRGGTKNRSQGGFLAPLRILLKDVQRSSDDGSLDESRSSHRHHLGNFG